MSKKVSLFLNELGLSYSGYIVSDTSNEKKMFQGMKVISCDDFVKTISNTGIILAMKKENTEEVMKKKEIKSYPVFLISSYIDVLEWQR